MHLILVSIQLAILGHAIRTHGYLILGSRSFVF